MKELRLCYIDKIPETFNDWDEESRKIIDSPGFYWKDSENHWRLRTKEYPNPEWVEGECEYYAYFTSAPLEEQWGDDWNDAPYEHNAGEPYEDEGYEIVKIPFAIPSSLEYKFPCDWAWGGNSSFSVEDINGGVIPWISVKTGKRKYVNIFAGISDSKFKEIMKELCGEQG